MVKEDHISEEAFQRYIHLCAERGVPLSETQTELWDTAANQAFTLEGLVSVFRKSGANKRRAKSNGISLLNLLTDYSVANNLESVPIEDVALNFYQRTKDVIQSEDVRNPLESDPFSAWDEKPYALGHTLFERLQEYLIGIGKIQEKDKTYVLKHVRIALGSFSVKYSQPILDGPIHEGLLVEAFGGIPGADKRMLMKARSSKTSLLYRMPKCTNASALALYLEAVNTLKDSRAKISSNYLGPIGPYNFIGLHNYLTRIGLVVNKNPQKV